MNIKLKNSDTDGYGLVTLCVHFSVAFLVVFLFFLGAYMVGLDYSDSLYYKAPSIHESVGLLCFFVLLFRFSWGLYNPLPKHYFIENLENYLVHAFHILFYILVFSIIISGYLIVTAKGVGVGFFNFFEIPSFMLLSANNVDKAGYIHEFFSYALVMIVFIHAIFYFKRNFIKNNK